jgi:hypothetical protein
VKGHFIRPGGGLPGIYRTLPRCQCTAETFRGFLRKAKAERSACVAFMRAENYKLLQIGIRFEQVGICS